jgi:hypothetical protein
MRQRRREERDGRTDREREEEYKSIYSFWYN